MAVPKSKLSSARKNSRRSSVWKMSAPTLVHCPKCGDDRMKAHIDKNMIHK